MERRSDRASITTELGLCPKPTDISTCSRLTVTDAWTGYFQNSPTHLTRRVQIRFAPTRRLFCRWPANSTWTPRLVWNISTPFFPPSPCRIWSARWQSRVAIPRSRSLFRPTCSQPRARFRNQTDSGCEAWAEAIPALLAQSSSSVCLEGQTSRPVHGNQMRTGAYSRLRIPSWSLNGGSITIDANAIKAATLHKLWPTCSAAEAWPGYRRESGRTVHPQLSEASTMSYIARHFSLIIAVLALAACGRAAAPEPGEVEELKARI